MIAILAAYRPDFTLATLLAAYRPDFTLATLFAGAVIAVAAVVAAIALRK